MFLWWFGRAGRCRSDVQFSSLRSRGRGEGSRQWKGEVEEDGWHAGRAWKVGPLILDQDKEVEDEEDQINKQANKRKKFAALIY